MISMCPMYDHTRLVESPAFDYLTLVSIAARLGGGVEIPWRDIELCARDAYDEESAEWVDVGGEA